jgi:hypothetical protein
MTCIGRLSLLLSVVLTASALLSFTAAQTSSQPLTIALDLGSARLAFSSDGSVLRIIGTSPAQTGTTDTQHLRAITYNAATGAVLHAIDLQPGTMALSTTADGRTAIVSSPIAGSNNLTALSLVDTEPGISQPIPTAWYDATDDDPDAELSADGRLISIYSESGPADGPMTVSVYNWPAMTLLAKQTSEYTSAGGAFGGGITPDGRAIEFVNNRAGIKLVDLNTGRDIASFGNDSVFSTNGNWVVVLPDISFLGDDASPQVLIKDAATGKTLGAINVPVPDDIAYGQMTGAFCGFTNRFIVASGHGDAAYAIPSGALLAAFPSDTWRDPSTANQDQVTVACSPTASRVAILSGTHLTLHVLK